MPTEIKMPQLGESVTEGTVGRWLKRPGERVEQYEALLEVTTDKVDTEVPSPAAGVVREIVVPEGTTVRVGALLAVLDDGASGAESGEQARTVSTESQQPADGSRQRQPASEAPAQAAGPSISPVVARLATEHNLDLRQIGGTGLGGRVTKQDVLRYLDARGKEQPAASAKETGQIRAELPKPTTPEPAVQEALIPAPQPAAPVAPPAAPAQAVELPEDAELLPISAMRRAIAEHMVRSRRTAPHVTTVAEVDMSRVATHRAGRKADFERQGVNLTYTPYFVLASVAGLQAVPIVNGSYTDQGIVMHQRIHIGVAVALEEGLIVPVVRDADEKNLLGLARTVNDLADRARARRLKPDETQGGTFTITNHGVSGSLFAMPIINQPQAAILGVGAIQKRAVVITQNSVDAIAIRQMCYLSLTFDHRLIDGATADRFLMTIKGFLEGYAE